MPYFASFCLITETHFFTCYWTTFCILEILMRIFQDPPQHYPKKPLGVTKNCLPDPFTLAVAPGVPPLAGRQAPESFLKGGGQGLPSVPSEASLGVWSVPFVGEEGTGDSALGGMRV